MPDALVSIMGIKEDIMAAECGHIDDFLTVDGEELGEGWRVIDDLLMQKRLTVEFEQPTPRYGWEWARQGIPLPVIR